MAFCNSCGATLTEGTKFCSKCGKPVAGATAAVAPLAASPAPPPAAGSNSAVKMVLIVVGAVVLIGVVGLVSLAFIGIHIAKRTHVTQEGDHVKVESPFGSVETSKDPDQAVKELGVDIYPGAEVQSNGATSTTFGGMHTASAWFESSDSVDKVCAFYKSKFPSATVKSSDQNRCTIVSTAPPNVITINVEASSDTSRFQITSVMKKSSSDP